ncbi:MAG: Ig-like domain repeat protein [Chloroflexi bacterium]|nr:Ig-like domain repeat protein [Chloroflexota bacterium]
MTPRRRLLLATALLAVVGLLGLASQAAAAQSPTLLSLRSPEAAALGAEVTLTATLRTQAGEPVAGARVLFSTPAEFGGVAGEMELGSGITNAAGTATLAYAPRRSGSNSLIARFAGDALHGPSEASAQIAVTGDAQLYVAQAGLRIPFLSVALLGGALAVVFSLYVVTTLLVMGIAREGMAAEGPEGGTK